MNGGILLTKHNGQWTRLEKTDYKQEDELQQILAEYPALIPADQIDSASPSQWLLVGREIGIANSATGSAKWSADLVLLDQYGIITLVETKLNKNREIRREVVGQLMEYAANVKKYWNVDKVFSLLTQTKKLSGTGIEGYLKQTFGENFDIDSYREQVASNLQAGNFQLLFVANELPPELKLMVEFLNEHMNPMKVLGVEIPLYSSEDSSIITYAPRLIGKIEQKAQSASLSRQKWDKVRFFENLDSNSNLIASEILDWAEQKDFGWRFGSGQVGTCIVYNKVPDRQLFQLLTNNTIVIWLQTDYAFAVSFPQAKQAEYTDMLKDVGFEIKGTNAVLQLEKWQEQGLPDKFFKTIEWYAGQLVWKHGEGSIL